MSKIVRLVKGSKTLVIKTVRTAGLATGPIDRVGWIRIVDVTVPGGSTANAVYEDPGNDTILQSIDVSDNTFDVVVESSYPTVEVEGIPGTIPLVGGVYRGSVQITLPADGPVVAKTITPDAVDAAEDTIQVAIDAPPQLLTLSFTGGYPGSQTELKAGDTYQITGTTDKSANGIEIQAFGAADAVQLLAFAPGTSFTVTMVVGDAGLVTQALPARGRARATTTGALGAPRDTNALGGTVDGTNTVLLNNTYPGISITLVTYPGGQSALKAAEQATVTNTVTDFTTVLYDSPTSELSPATPGTFEGAKVVTRIAGGYNVTTDNFRITANRAENDATTIDSGLVQIANTPPTITVTESAARLRSGGNDGTSPQNHTITISSDQNLLSIPSLDADSGGSRGTFLGAFSGGPAVWTAQLQVADTDEKGTFTWENLSATSLSGIVVGSITGDDQYVLGGFVARTLTFAAFATTSAMNVEVADFSKLQAGIFTATNQPALKQAIGTPPSVTDGFTIDAVGINPTDVIWLDTPASSANSGGTAQITDVEEVV